QRQLEFHPGRLPVGGGETIGVDTVVNSHHLPRWDPDLVDQPPLQVLGHGYKLIDERGERPPEPVTPGVTASRVGAVATVLAVNDRWRPGEPGRDDRVERRPVA